MAGKLETSPERPVSVRRVNELVGGWIERLGPIWVEGEVAQLNSKPNWALSYVTLRDTQANASVPVTCRTSLLRDGTVTVGSQVVLHAKPAFYQARGSFSLMAAEFRPVGEGELLARIERLKQALAAEGLFDPRLKRTPPFLPRRVGLITGRGSDAERDVLNIARERWPEVDVAVRNTAVQGARAVPEILAALAELDAEEPVEVIIIARGGGSVQDLLPFSEETLVRAVSRARTPVVSAIGHAMDTPLLDNVADVRAATPTDAAKRVVPDVVEERRRIAEARARTADALRRWVQREEQALAQLRSRPALADPLLAVTRRAEELDAARLRLRRGVAAALERQEAAVAGLRGKISALGPAATLARGYAVVQVQPRDGSGDQVVTTIGQAPPGSQLRIRVTDGAVTAAAMGVRPAD